MPVLTYTLQRLGLLLLAAVALVAVGMRGWLVVLVATLVGWALSYLVLPRQRDAAARWLAERDARRRAERGPDEDALAEDAEAAAVDRTEAPDGSGSPDRIEAPDGTGTLDQADVNDGTGTTDQAETLDEVRTARAVDGAGDPAPASRPVDGVEDHPQR